MKEDEPQDIPSLRTKMMGSPPQNFHKDTGYHYSLVSWFEAKRTATVPSHILSVRRSDSACMKGGNGVAMTPVLYLKKKKKIKADTKLNCNFTLTRIPLGII